MNTTAFGLIDAQRGFMPADEGTRLGVLGFGELPVHDGERIVPKVNALLGACALHEIPVFTTQDWHPETTAHFAAEPNYNTTWPVHCVQDTPGSELHPDLQIPLTAARFKKGNEVLLDGREDTSYSGFNAKNKNELTLPEWLTRRKITEVVLGGLALDYCVRATALDLRQKMGLDVILITDATEPVAQETGLSTIDELEAAGVRFMTTEQYLEVIAKTAL